MMTLLAAAAETVGTGGLDFAGLGALVTAVSGLFATVGALYLGGKQKSTAATEKALEMLIKLQAQAMEHEDEPEA